MSAGYANAHGGFLTKPRFKYCNSNCFSDQLAQVCVRHFFPHFGRLICSYMDLHAHTCTNMYQHGPTCTYMDLHGPTCTCMYQHGPTWTYMYLHVPTWTYMDLHVPTCTYILLVVLYLVQWICSVGRFLIISGACYRCLPLSLSQARLGTVTKWKRRVQ